MAKKSEYNSSTGNNNNNKSLFKYDNQLFEFFNQLYWPSPYSLFFIFGIWLVFFILTFFTQLNIGWIIDINELVAIHAGISAIIFALIIFIAQNANEYEDKIRVLLKETFLFPLLIATIFGFFNFISGKVSLGSYLFTFLICAFLIFSVYNLISILLDKHLYFTTYLNLIYDTSKKDFNRLVNADENEERRIRTEFKIHRDRFQSAITGRKIGKVEESIEIYRILIKSFINSSKHYQKSSNEYYGLNQVINWVYEDIHKIFRVAMDYNDIEMVLALNKLLYSIVINGARYNNLDLFEKFLEFRLMFYKESLHKNEDLKSIMVDRTWRNLESISKSIEIEMDKKSYEGLELKEFSKPILVIYHKLLKESFYKRDLESYKKFIASYNRIFTNKDVGTLKNQLNFWTTAYILSYLNHGPEDIEYFKTIFKSLPNDFVEFTTIFLSSRTLNAEKVFSRIGWETIPEHVVVSFNPLTKIDEFYVIGVLKLLKNVNDIDKLDLVFDNYGDNQDLASLADQKNVTELIKNIQESSDEWKPILDSSEISNINNFKNILEKFKKIWNVREREKIVATQIEPEKVEELKQKIFNYIQGKKSLKDFFIYCDSYNFINKLPRKVSKTYIVEFKPDKPIFFKKWDPDYIEISSPEYGRLLTLSENQILFGKISDCCTEIQESDFEKKIKQHINEELVILVSGNLSSQFIHSSGKFKEKELVTVHNPNKIISGYYSLEKDIIPVVEILSSGIDKILLICKNNLGELIQYPPIKTNESTENIFDLEIDVLSENSNLLEYYVKNPSDNFKKIGNSSEIRAYLETLVRIRIFERFDYKNENKAGYFITFNEK